MLAALRHRTFRLYFGAQLVSNVGTWVQITVENWLVLELSHSGVAVGITNALQFGPSLAFGLYGGVLADRCERRRILLVTQCCLGLLALTVGVLAGTGSLTVWMIWLAAAALGAVKCFDVPAAQALLKDLVGAEDVANAVAWTNTLAAIGRTLGPALGGVVLVGFGAPAGFLINAASFVAVVVALAMLRRRTLSPRRAVVRAPGQIRAGLRYVAGHPVLAGTALTAATVYACAYNFQVSLALLAATALPADGRAYGDLMSALGLGAAAGSLGRARWPRTGLRPVLTWAAVLALAQLALAAAEGRAVLLAACFGYGAGAGAFGVTVTATLQASTADAMRGRVMALHSVCFMGVSLFGGPGFGALAGWLGVGKAFAVTAAICAVAAVVGAVAARRADPGGGRPG